jgi:alpha-glucosidase (family GH31 glycosyl hydrolase)
MESLVTVSYTLEKEPLQFTFLNQEESILSLSTSFRFVNMQPKKNGVIIKTNSGTLSLQQHIRQFKFRWQGAAVENRIRLEGRWFGIGELVNQPWDLTEIMLPLSEFLTADAGATGYSNLMTPAFINEHGALLLVRSPIQLGINQPPKVPEELPEFVVGQEIPFDQRPAFDRGRTGDGDLTLVGDNLSFDLFIMKDALEAHSTLIKEVGHPVDTPSLSLFRKPIWTTWAQYKADINQETVLDFAQQIINQGYPYQVLEIDDRWQIEYGDLEFDPERFPDPVGMVEQLHQMGFQVTAWVVPFLHKSSKAGMKAVEHGFVVRQPDDEPYPVRWWQGKAYLLDATNPAAMDWFGAQLRQLQQETGLDGFKFDGGEAMFVPRDAILHTPGASHNQYSHDYVDWVGRNFSLCEVRTGWFNQRSPILFRLWDLFSNWGRDNGLSAVIPATLQLSLTGYPFIIPDMIGGNGYFSHPKNKLLNNLITKVIIPMMERRKQTETGDEDVGIHASDVPDFIRDKPMFGWPNAELMIRWTQLNALLPVMQFSITPWQFGEKCAEICKSYAHLHLEFTPVFETLAKQAAHTGEQIIRPVFFLDPRNPDALACGDQFLVGDQILVAPVVEKGARKRDLFLPPGEWRDHWSSETHTGPKTIEGYPAPLERLPFFHRV